ncbi:MAG: beta-propeller domain-containing protein [bacterium]|nr:beta-propeller domain-containing protein [bacterium]
MKEKNKSIVALVLIIGGIFTALILIAAIFVRSPNNLFPLNKTSTDKKELKVTFKKFSSEQEIKEYLRNSQSSSNFSSTNSTMELRSDNTAPTSQMGQKNSSDAVSTQTSPDRYSTTNTQILGIDEPDSVKSNGKYIFNSIRDYGNYRNIDTFPVDMQSNQKIIAPGFPTLSLKTKIINALPPEGISKISEINESGNLIISGNTLIILSDQKILGFNITDPKNPTKSWEQALKNNTQIKDARLLKERLYIVTQTYLNSDKPCPIEILGTSNSSTTINCKDIYRPNISINSSSTLTALSMEPASGKITSQGSYLSSLNNAIVYMSQNNLYTTHEQSIDNYSYMYKFFTGTGKDLISQDKFQQLEKLNNYDISNEAKMVELNSIINYVYNKGSDNDEQLKFRNELQNRMASFAEKNKRDFGKTIISKISLENMSVVNTGTIPGQLLNQFSIDEYKNNLRIATTVGGNNNFFGVAKSANDIYILNNDLSVKSSIVDLGLDERIYSARFIGDKGYLVTFRQTDPFYILDLSNPDSPKMTGQLKIPGYSSYLHPLKNNLILGIGKEDSKVKATIFDVSNPTSPTESDTYILDEYNSDILQTHHAFLHDPKHEIFFIPGDSGGYIFNYENDKIKLEKAVADISPKRALFINDFLYIIASDKIKVYNEKTWSEAKELVL